MGFYCDDLLLKKVDFVADALQWTRNTVIIESIIHVINLVEQFDNKVIPNFLILTRALQHSKRYDFRLIGKLFDSEKSKKINTGVSIHPMLLKKIDHVIVSTPYSRNSFIIDSIIHALNIVEDEKADPIPNVVKICRNVATPIKLHEEKDRKPIVFDETSKMRLHRRLKKNQ